MVNKESKAQEKAQLDVTPEWGQAEGQKLPLSDFSTFQNFVYATLFVIGIALITLIIQYFTATQATFEDLKDKVVQQSAKIDALTDEIHRQKGF
ncbi:MAG: hypothetical protein KGI50_04385 [Patescibacteria group bacterium]|nr:hypothetical protein [Patescibacteria group bacterium]MDE2438476.1 hypothetical protein [Patescibacteria group bacterium]